MEFLKKSFEELNSKELYQILKAREKIFIVGQKNAYSDLDDLDYKSTHFFIRENNEIVAYIRAFYKSENTIKIGRVLTLKHGKGFGRILMENTINEIKRFEGINKIYVSAQTHAVEFYKKFGFAVTSCEFIEDGIMRMPMELDL